MPKKHPNACKRSKHYVLGTSLATLLHTTARMNCRSRTFFTFRLFTHSHIQQTRARALTRNKQKPNANRFANQLSLIFAGNASHRRAHILTCAKCNVLHTQSSNRAEMINSIHLSYRQRHTKPCIGCSNRALAGQSKLLLLR